MPDSGYEEQPLYFIFKTVLFLRLKIIKQPANYFSLLLTDISRWQPGMIFAGSGFAHLRRDMVLMQGIDDGITPGKP